jgi:hypothetical protein
MYELKGIVVHAGSAFAGHYYSYIKERPKQLPDGTMVPGSWWCFDDKVGCCTTGPVPRKPRWHSCLQLLCLCIPWGFAVWMRVWDGWCHMHMAGTAQSAAAHS